MAATPKVWTRLLGGRDGDYQNSVVTGADDSIFLAGYAIGQTVDGHQNIYGNGDAFITRYNSDGSTDWSRLLGGTGDEWAYGVSAGFDGTVYVAGYTTSRALDDQLNFGESAAFIARYDSNGNKVWTKLLGCDGYTCATGVSTGADGAIYLGGASTSSTLGDQTKSGTDQDAFIVRYNYLYF